MNSSRDKASDPNSLDGFISNILQNMRAGGQSGHMSQFLTDIAQNRLGDKARQYVDERLGTSYNTFQRMRRGLQEANIVTGSKLDLQLTEFGKTLYNHFKAEFVEERFSNLQDSYIKSLIHNDYEFGLGKRANLAEDTTANDLYPPGTRTEFIFTEKHVKKRYEEDECIPNRSLCMSIFYTLGEGFSNTRVAADIFTKTLQGQGGYKRQQISRTAEELGVDEEQVCTSLSELRENWWIDWDDYLGRYESTETARKNYRRTWKRESTKMRKPVLRDWVNQYKNKVSGRSLLEKL